MMYPDNAKYAKYHCHFCKYDIKKFEKYFDMRLWDCPKCGTCFATVSQYHRHKLKWIFIYSKIVSQSILLDLEYNDTSIYKENKLAYCFNYLIPYITPSNLDSKIKTLLVFS